MKRNSEIRKKATALRRKGYTYSEIQKILRTDIPKSTLSYWCKDVQLPKEYEERISKIVANGAERGRKIAVAVNRVRREKYLKALEKRNLYLLRKLDKDVLKIALAMLYLGEGSKWQGRRGLCLGSSDPNIIDLYLKSLRACYNINEDKLRCRVGHRADQELNNLQKFWSKITKIPLKYFYRTKPDPRTIGKRTKREDYKGVCVVYYGSTEIQLELEIIANLIIKSGPVV